MQIVCKRRWLSGFTLTELLVVVSIISILLALGIPSYQNYTKTAYYAEVVKVATPYRLAVDQCLKKLGKLAVCNAGSNHIPAAINHASKLVTSVKVINGVITVTPFAAYGITEKDLYVLTPHLEADGFITWAVSGDGLKYVQ